METLSNSELTIKVSALGAELSSISANHSGTEYLWQGDPAFWKRRSPVLFPIVGALWENRYRNDGAEYPMSQHGFARDSEFRLVKHTGDELLYALCDNEESRKAYPFNFVLEIGYRLTGNEVEVSWTVRNNGVGDMYFQIGAHPAFYYPGFDPAVKERGFLSFGGADGLEYILFSENGCVAGDKHPLNLQDGMLPLDTHTFDNDALIFEDGQIKTVRLYDKERKPYLSLHFSAPVLGLWSPPGKNAPFICIEPWYGRTDKAGYNEEFRDKDWIKSLAPGEVFCAAYSIAIENL